MSIHTLSAGTVRILGSCQSITSPASVVKELVENALDARASSILVEIAANTLDVIQVRDDGHGIPPDDRHLICRRYCTSKISNEADLRAVGGRSLGFRGEALASAAELAGGVLVSTRVASEICAAALRFGTTGELSSQESVGHPLGTTVRVESLFAEIPVRKQHALKTVSKTLAQIKRTLQAYALFRPNVRLALKVLKARNEKNNWAYVPSTNPSLTDAALKVAGVACATQCEPVVAEANDYKVQALLPRVDADMSKISGLGSFLAVDSRPVGATRGTLLQIAKLCRETIRNSSHSCSSVKDAFFAVDISCPSQSYDPNVEPAKDDVLFEDGDKAEEAVRRALNSYYPVRDEANAKSPKRTASKVINLYDEDYRGYYQPAKRRRIYTSNSDSTTGNTSRHLHDTNDLAPVAPDPEDTQHMSCSNPWVFAQLATSTKHGSIKHTQSPRKTSIPLRDTTNIALQAMANLHEGDIPPYPPWALPTPDPSSSPERTCDRTSDSEPLPSPTTRLGKGPRAATVRGTLPVDHTQTSKVPQLQYSRENTAPGLKVASLPLRTAASGSALSGHNHRQPRAYGTSQSCEFPSTGVQGQQRSNHDIRDMMHDSVMANNPENVLSVQTGKRASRHLATDPKRAAPQQTSLQTRLAVHHSTRKDTHSVPSVDLAAETILEGAQKFLISRMNTYPDIPPEAARDRLPGMGSTNDEEATREIDTEKGINANTENEPPSTSLRAPEPTDAEVGMWRARIVGLLQEQHEEAFAAEAAARVSIDVEGAIAGGYGWK